MSNLNRQQTIKRTIARLDKFTHLKTVLMATFLMVFCGMLVLNAYLLLYAPDSPALARYCLYGSIAVGLPLLIAFIRGMRYVNARIHFCHQHLTLLGIDVPR